jgi:hypothetical protein
MIEHHQMRRPEKSSEKGTNRLRLSLNAFEGKQVRNGAGWVRRFELVARWATELKSPAVNDER